MKDVRTLICKYRDLIYPLDNISHKRGHRWRDTRFIGNKKSEAFSNIITRIYEPVICAVVEEMTSNDVHIWIASDNIEQMRLPYNIQGGWCKFVSEKISCYKKIHSRNTYLKKLHHIFSNCGE